ncbi:hypothetical protein T484DRAFT_3635980 [Baffinella frigidus]|nr:hypothetical protein T484DRAFT_3635980 [Cryptophyta sp. CCMP2293]
MPAYALTGSALKPGPKTPRGKAPPPAPPPAERARSTQGEVEVDAFTAATEWGLLMGASWGGLLVKTSSAENREQEAKAQVQAVREETARHVKAGYSLEHSVAGRSAVPPPAPHPFVGTHGAPRAHIVPVAAELSGSSIDESEAEPSTEGFLGTPLEDSVTTLPVFWESSRPATARPDLGRKSFGRNGPPSPLDVTSPLPVYTPRSPAGSVYTPRSPQSGIFSTPRSAGGAPLLLSPPRSARSRLNSARSSVMSSLGSTSPPGLLLPQSAIRRARNYKGEFLVNDTLLLSATLSAG